MSIHKSLVIKTKLKRHRNVLKRDERIESLIQTGRWKEGDSIFKLPKVRVYGGMKKTKAGKGAKKKEKAGK